MIKLHYLWRLLLTVKVLKMIPWCWHSIQLLKKLNSCNNMFKHCNGVMECALHLKMEIIKMCSSFFHGAPMRRVVKDCGSEIWQLNSTLWEIKPIAIEHINEGNNNKWRLLLLPDRVSLCEIVRAPSYTSTS